MTVLSAKLFPGENRSVNSWNSMEISMEIFMENSMEFHGIFHENPWNFS
jgi:hypothetical protein